MRSGILISNNPLVGVRWISGTSAELLRNEPAVNVLIRARDYIHKGHILLTHPLHSSLKPNETPYRTVMISKKPNTGVDLESLNYIETALQAYHKFLKDSKPINWPWDILHDFQIIDYELIKNAIE